jgi:serine/threonine protein kinase
MGVESGTSLGPYQILSLLGAGGMGRWWPTTPARRDVAVKTIAASLAGEPDALARFQREASAPSPRCSTEHPRDLRHRVPQRKYLVTELLQGELGGATRGSCRKKAVDIAAPSPTAWRSRTRRRSSIATKPENIFVTADDRIKILTAVWQVDVRGGGQRRRRHACKIPPSPIDPTRACLPNRCRTVPTRSDIFALACCTRCFGPAPHQRSTAETIAAILKDPALVLRPRAPCWPSWTGFWRCLEKDRARRFQSAQDLAFALGALATGPVAVRPAVQPSRASVAVLPFLNLSADPDNEFFADGITEDVIAHLSKVR